MTVFQEILIVYFIAINVTTFLTFGIDKWKAKQGSWRVSEATLLGLAVIGGCIGALLGMRVLIDCDKGSCTPHFKSVSDRSNFFSKPFAISI